jgi:pimeloyl-ACP methyl ester carboxylesterase
VEELTIGTPDGRSLTVYDAGDPDGRPILFHHGTPASGVPFDQHVGMAREQGVRLLSYDRSGYGDLTRNPERVVADVVQDVEAIANALGLEHFATWGLSGGGLHALATAAGLPDRVFAVAAVASIAPPDRPELDLTDGMDEVNIVEFRLAQQGGRTASRAGARLRGAREAQRPGVHRGDAALPLRPRRGLRSTVSLAPSFSTTFAAASRGAWTAGSTTTSLSLGRGDSSSSRFGRPRSSSRDSRI